MIIYPALFIFVYCISMLAAASVSDIKTREVPDFISYALIIGGFLLTLAYAITQNSIGSIIFLPASVALLFGFSYLMYNLGQWAGGDVKLMLGLSLMFTSASLFSNLSFVALFLNILVFGGLYGLLGTLVFGLLKFRSLAKLLRLYDYALIPVGAAVIMIFLYLLPQPVNYLAAFAAFLLVAMRYIYIIDQNLTYVEVRTDKLTEGDWIAGDVRDNDGKLVVSKRNIGLLSEDIHKIKEANIKKVLVKIGLPFVPGLLCGALVTILFGNPLLSIIQAVF